MPANAANPSRRALAALAGALALTTAAYAQAPASPTPDYTPAPVRPVVVARGLERPWAMAFLPDGAMLVTERPGRMRIVASDGRVGPPLAGVPAVHARGQGGLLDVVLSPQFAADRLVYFSFAEPGEGGAGTAVARARLAADGLQDVQVIWRQMPKVGGNLHFGSRLVFARDGTLFVTLGERYAHRDEAQNLANTLGKIVRIRPDGSIPPDNPFVGRRDARPEIWSYGHRNVQAAALDPATGALWIVMHGARGGDELDRPLAGRNYGWPVITYGRDYSGARIGVGTAREGMEQPVYYWDPVIAPSAAAFYTADRIPAWRGRLLVGSLTPGGLVVLTLAGGRVAGETRHLAELGRVRDLRIGPDGLVYLAIDSADAPIVRLEPSG